MNATSKQRRDRILAEAYQRRHITAKDLAAHMDVSEATVRRDLKALADSGHLELVYGGATLRRPAVAREHAPDTANREAKRIIGGLAAGMVGDNEQIFVDSGTTCFEMVPHLRRRTGLFIIVNSARLALELDAPGVSVLLLGGQYRPDRMDTIGPLAMTMLDQLRGYTCFIGADGLGMDFGPAAADIDSANLYRRAVRNAGRTVMLVDHTKFVAPALFRIVEWEVISRLVTDQRPPAAWCDFLNARGIELTFPDGNGQDPPRDRESQ